MEYPEFRIFFLNSSHNSSELPFGKIFRANLIENLMPSTEKRTNPIDDINIPGSNIKI